MYLGGGEDYGLFVRVVAGDYGGGLDVAFRGRLAFPGFSKCN